MNKQEIMNAIKELSYSQGFYGRIYEHLKEDNEWLEYLASENFKDIVELVMFLEGKAE